ncbi:hypothetical protein [Kiritimatiella glycovorans]|uniref:Uncharacterized protein n=1 Tax=Kiritimatiella glycovorans TaxID=1307763 RepID=A0A0G3EJK8_9BACT|nr:hypothetical protein [Kiritimatiella glycovorans]AKJ64309.1 putative protein involved in outer membrane biogenesis [Kiritimatiella glycovorans]
MTDKKKASKKTKREGPGRGSGVAGALFFFAAVLLILYITAHLMVRTDGFRTIVTRRLAKRCGMPVHLDRTLLTADLKLKITGVSMTAEGQGAQPAIRISEATVRPRWLNAFRKRDPWMRTLRLDGVEAQFVRRENGTWAPDGLRRAAEALAPVFGLPETTKPGTEGALFDFALLRDARVVMERGRLIWNNRNSAAVAFAEGVRAEWVPLQLPGRMLYGLQLESGRVQLAGGGVVRGLETEMLWMPGRYEVLRFAARNREGNMVAMRPPEPEPPLSDRVRINLRALARDGE